MNLISWAIPFFLLAIVIEWLWGLARRQNTYRLNDAISSLMLGILSQIRKLLSLGVVAWIYGASVDLIGVRLWSTNDLTNWIAAFVLYDLCYYWLHRCSHERQILWAAHVAHHQSEDYNLSTALRQTSTGAWFGWIFYLPLFLLGVPAEMFVTVGALNLIYQFWVHTRHIPELGPLEWIFVTPSNHRVHHAQNDCYVDTNYGGVFILWDRVFGTYQAEQVDVPCIYGIRGAIRRFSPWVALTHIYRDILSDLWHTKSWRNRLRILLARTGWQPDDLPLGVRREKRPLGDFQRFDPQVGVWARAYAFYLLLVMTALLMDTLLLRPTAPMAMHLLVALMLLWTGILAACHLEGRRGALMLGADLARWCLFAWMVMRIEPQATHLLWMVGVGCVLALKTAQTEPAMEQQTHLSGKEDRRGVQA